MPRVKLLSKILLSFWIVYHLFAMLIMPNVGSYLGRSTSPFIAPYANSIGMNASWNFFSPDPAYVMYIHYLVNFRDNDGNLIKESVDGFFPEEKNKSISSLFRKREFYVMRYMVINPQRLKTLMAPWLCRQYPQSTSVELEFVVETVPTLEQAAAFHGDNIRDLSQEMQFGKETVSCEENQEVPQ
ncbi:MAG TPA: hypothetical protein VN132_02115 [Bdellovibrio sp.]|nr:hypothetical protein [Bdellovibrio sp.]